MANPVMPTKFDVFALRIANSKNLGSLVIGISLERRDRRLSLLPRVKGEPLRDLLFSRRVAKHHRESPQFLIVHTRRF